MEFEINLVFPCLREGTLTSLCFLARKATSSIERLNKWLSEWCHEVLGLNWVMTHDQPQAKGVNSAYLTNDH